MRYWRIKVFINNRGYREFDLWLDDLAIKDSKKIDTRIKQYFEITKHWNHREYFAPLENGIFEIRLYGVQKVPLRPLGCFGPQRHEFTILLGAIKKNDHYEPNDAIEIAKKRSKLVHEKGRTEYY